MLTTAQLQALKADILLDGALASLPNNSDAAFTIAAAYNQLASPNFTVWRTDVPVKDAKKATVWTEYIGRSQGERDAYQFMLSNGILDASDTNIRQGITDIFSGPTGANTRAALTAIAKRFATRAEKLFATGTGSDAAPAVMSFEGTLSFQDVEQARNLP